MAVAEEVAKWSKDPSTKVGAVIFDSSGRILSTGYNGFPRGVYDHEERYLDRETKYKFVVHAELNAILNATQPLTGDYLYVTLSPCSECAKAIIQSGIVSVTYRDLRSDPYTNIMFREAGVEMQSIKEW
jgi:dCMP deaminase